MQYVLFNAKNQNKNDNIRSVESTRAALTSLYFCESTIHHGHYVHHPIKNSAHHLVTALSS